MANKLFINFSATKVFFEVDYYLKSAIRRGILATLEHEDFGYDAEVSVTFCDNKYIHNLNKKYRDVDSPTDVLSFPMYEGGDFPEEECENGALLGDIVISLERAREQAQELGHGFVHEVVFLCVHSTLHLLGYDHVLSTEEDERQCRAQREIMDKLEF